MSKKIKEVLDRCGIKPMEMRLFEEAFTHPSYVNEHKDVKQYQRLEFLGDAILQLYTSLNIYKRYPNMNEGEMSIMRASVVNSIKLAELSEKINLQSAIRFGKSAQNLEQNIKIKSDVFEALVAAIYLDLGRGALLEFFDKTVVKCIKRSNGIPEKNPKTKLQEFLQSESRGSIEYDTESSDRGFVATVKQDGKKYGKGSGLTKKEAEVNAAKNALEKVGK